MSQLCRCCRRSGPRCCCDCVLRPTPCVLHTITQSSHLMQAFFFSSLLFCFVLSFWRRANGVHAHTHTYTDTYKQHVLMWHYLISTLVRRVRSICRQRTRLMALNSENASIATRRTESYYCRHYFFWPAAAAPRHQ